jgi:hypothetical protein
VPDEKLVTRFAQTFINLRQALSFVNHALLFDNSSADETRSVFDRYNVVGDGDLRDAARRLGHTGGHTSPSVAVSGNANPQNH